MSQLQERIAQFRKMASDDPENELGHYRLGQLLAEAGQHEDAAQSYRRTLEISPQFSKVYHLLAQSLDALGRKDEAIGVLNQGYKVAEERGDRMPREAMGDMLVQLGQPRPQGEPAPVNVPRPAGAGGFQCRRMMCPNGAMARQLEKPPFNDELGRNIYEQVCAQCWHSWLKDQSVKVINELRLDLSSERGAEEYDKQMRDYLSLSE